MYHPHISSAFAKAEYRQRLRQAEQHCLAQSLIKKNRIHSLQAALNGRLAHIGQLFQRKRVRLAS